MGARILNYVLLVIAGIVLGVLGTVAQQTILSIGRTALPSGLIIALLAVGCLLVGLRLVNRSRWPSFAAALGVVIPAAVFAVPSEGGSVLIPGNAYGYGWILGAFALAIAIVGWPSSRIRAAAPNRPAPAPAQGGDEQNGPGQSF
jgi:hypothetical protein